MTVSFTVHFPISNVRRNIFVWSHLKRLITFVRIIGCNCSLHEPHFWRQIFDGKMSGMKSLARSSDAIPTYSEETGSPVFSIASSLILTNVTVNSGAKGKVSSVKRKSFSSFFSSITRSWGRYVPWTSSFCGGLVAFDHQQRLFGP